MDDNRTQQEKILTPGDAANNNIDGLEGAPIESEPEEHSADDRLAALEAELEDQKDRLLRALAETEKVRRRAQREREDASKVAVAGFAKVILSAAANLRSEHRSTPDTESWD